ncbi:MAG: type II toxin-antitoxin system RelE/ParE family toxin [Verrucomicrobiales bacterium]|nr:type II toxin-antitoxin system RelE/ParE family toxin [Verrucomicrobiales bacterium]
MIVRYDDEALEEAMEAAAWYETQQEGLVRRYLTKWKTAELKMLAAPEINRIFDPENQLRRCRFEVFPYALIYRIKDDEVQVIAVAHQHQEPGYWRHRLEQEES